MFECLVLGDSIGLGVAAEINRRLRAGCDVAAAQNVTTEQLLLWRPPIKAYGTTIIAVSSNDVLSAALPTSLAVLRRQLSTRRAIWLLPYSRPRAYVVNRIAMSFGDETLDLRRFETRDNVHPAKYRDVASKLLR